MDLISQFVPNEFPLYLQNNGPDLVGFIQMYAEWLDQYGNPEWFASNLANFRDIDNTLDQFISFFQFELANKFPQTVAVDKRLLLKHITNLYQSKGTKRGFKLLFRILFNEDINVYLPGKDVFKLSDNQWVQPIYIEVSDSAFLPNLVGQSIYSLGSGATALVEDFNIIVSNQKVINVLSLSNIDGLFLYGDKVMSYDVPYTANQASSIVGSLSAAAIINGGIFWKVGDLVNVQSASGVKGAVARVASTTSENGKVIFTLNNGGFGFTMNAVVQVLGGGGTGASFSVGSLVDQQVYSINIDNVGPYYNTELDILSEGFNLGISSPTGLFSVGEVAIATTANSSIIDFVDLTANGLSKSETLSNSSLGISGINIIDLETGIMEVTGTNANLALLTANTLLVSSTTHTNIKINSNYFGIMQNSCNGTITFANSSLLTLYNCNNYFLTTGTIVGQTSGKSATISSVTRNTNWGFPGTSISNLDTQIDNLLVYENLTIGTIASLTNENPGALYASNPTVVIEEPLIYELGIQDGLGGYWGFDANVTANAIYANGIATSLQIVASGYGFNPGDLLYASNEGNISTITAAAIVDSNGVGEGYWTSNKSQLSDQIYLQDSFYYQNYSFEIQAPRDLSTYANTVTDLMAPVGYMMFGKFLTTDSQQSASGIAFNSFVQSE